MLKAALEAAITTVPRLLMAALNHDVGNREHRSLNSGGQADSGESGFRLSRINPEVFRLQP